LPFVDPLIQVGVKEIYADPIQLVAEQFGESVPGKAVGKIRPKRIVIGQGGNTLPFAEASNLRREFM